MSWRDEHTTHVRVHNSTRKLLDEERQWMLEAYSAGRSVGFTCPDGMSLDSVIAYCVQQVRMERERKNGYGVGKESQAILGGSVLTPTE